MKNTLRHKCHASILRTRLHSSNVSILQFRVSFSISFHSNGYNANANEIAGEIPRDNVPFHHIHLRWPIFGGFIQFEHRSSSFGHLFHSIVHFVCVIKYNDQPKFIKWNKWIAINNCFIYVAHETKYKWHFLWFAKTNATTASTFVSFSVVLTLIRDAGKIKMRSRILFIWACLLRFWSPFAGFHDTFRERCLCLIGKITHILLTLYDPLSKTMLPLRV